MRVGVVGAGGRMGRQVCLAVAGHTDLELVAAVDPVYAGKELATVVGPEGGALTVAGELEALGEGRHPGGGGLHPDRGSPPDSGLLRRCRHPRRGRDHRVLRGGPRCAGTPFRRSGPGEPQLHRGRQLRRRRRIDDALRRVGCTLVRRCRNRRAPSREQDRCPVRNGADHGPSHGRCPGVGGIGPVPPRRDPRTPWSPEHAGPTVPVGCASTRCVCPAWSPTRRSSWDRRARP